MSPEQAFALTDPHGVLYLPGAFELALGAIAAVPRMEDAFRTGAGLGWHEHDAQVFSGCEKFFRPGYLAHLVPEWIPALDGVQQQLEAGARVADIGCGHGASTILLAEAFPQSTIVGSDYHAGSIEEARSARGRGRRDRPGHVRGRGCPVVLRHRLRAGRELRLPARHGRPAGRGQARAQHARPRRQLADRRAGRRRQRRREPQPGRPGLLQLLDAALRAQRDVAAGRLRAGRAGRRAGDPPGLHRRRASPGSAGSRRRRSTWSTRPASDGGRAHSAACA